MSKYPECDVEYTIHGARIYIPSDYGNHDVVRPYIQLENSLVGERENARRASLLYEAFTVANETGMTPQELWNQRSDLLKALKEIAETPHTMVNDSESLRHTLRQIDLIACSAINEATGN